MRALFLRHGESAHNAHTGNEPLSEEHGDLLTDRGREQALAAGEALRGEGITRLLSSPMRRAAETAEAVGASLGMEVEAVPYAHEFHAGESFDEALERVRLLKAELESGDDGELPLLITHGIFTRFFLLDSVLDALFTPAMLARIWHLGSSNCGLTVFAHGELREPGGAPVATGWTCLTWMTRPWDPP
jgi:broad specificity phosphatase PhoE